MEAIELPAVARQWLFEVPRQSREVHHRSSRPMHRSSHGVKVSVSWNRIVDAMIQFAGGDFAKLPSSMCMKLIAEYVGLVGFIALALSLIKPSARCGARLPIPHQLKAKGGTRQMSHHIGPEHVPQHSLRTRLTTQAPNTSHHMGREHVPQNGPRTRHTTWVPNTSFNMGLERIPHH